MIKYYKSTLIKLKANVIIIRKIDKIAYNLEPINPVHNFPHSYLNLLPTKHPINEIAP